MPFCFAHPFAGIALCVGLAGCTAGTLTPASIEAAVDMPASPRVVEAGEPVPEGGGRYQIGKPYAVAGKWYEPKHDPDYDREGMASWYGAKFHGRLTANGEVFDIADLSAAHPTLPLPSYVRVTNIENDRSLIVRVNDRGPYAHDRLIDVSERAAKLLGFQKRGMARVRVEYVDKAPLDGGDETFLLASYQGPALDVPVEAEVMLASAAAPQRLPAPEPAVRLASAAAHAPPVPAERPAETRAVAFAASPADAPASAAVEVLTTPQPAGDRIDVAFQLISEMEGW
jgi:rare lipoprotein A